MTAWPFVVAAYAVTVAGTAALLAWTWWTMRAAEAAVDALSRK